MKLGFYYHIPITLGPNGTIGMPAFLGRFIDSLADEVEELVLFAHVATNRDVAEYHLNSTNVRLANLGIKRPAYLRFLLPSIFLKRWREEFQRCDFLLIRSPSPLASSFSKYVDASKLVYMVVGSYKEGLHYLNSVWYKAFFIKALNICMHREFIRTLRFKRIIVNSQVLLEEYKDIAQAIHLTFTTTLTEDSFYFSLKRCEDPENYKILYVGRLDLAKGISEAIESVALIRNRGLKATLQIVGWDDTGKVVDYLKQKAKQLGIANYVVFHGKKATGPELFSFYRNSDIYVLPSYHEGFPRTIWEAFANSIPVISTKVGSIPFFLIQDVHASLVTPKSTSELSMAIERLIKDVNYRNSLIRNAYKMVGGITLKKQSSEIIAFIKSNKNPN